MKFAYKLTAAMVLLLGMVLSLGGYVMIKEDFNRNFKIAIQQNTQSHIREKYALELAILQEQKSTIQLYQYGKSLADNAGTAYSFAIYTADYASVFSNLPLEIGKTRQIEIIKLGEEKVYLLKEKAESYICLSSRLVTDKDAIYLLSAYPITSLFAARDAQLSTFLRIELIALAAAGAAAFIVSLWLTRHVRRLDAVSREIASGAFDKRTNIHTTDEIGDLSQSFNIMADAVEAKIQMLSASIKERNDFVSAFTHELKTPMTSILGYADILRTGVRDIETQKTAADYIYYESKRLETLSHKLMQLMHLESENKIALCAVTLAIVKTALERSLPQSEVLVNISFSANGTVLADKDLLVDLLYNLILNAMRASASGKTVWVFAEEDESEYHFCVKDEGCGIPAEELSRIEEPFYMVDKSRAHAQNGSGMGLALCKKICNLHGTALKIESTLGKGTAVSFSLKKPTATENNLPLPENLKAAEVSNNAKS
ncbi:MAG: HAMP domain-containing sensor histidine kinase [Oscillospiraceae bacterium]